MKLVSFSVTNYRSITRAHKIALNQYTVLLGKNNEGKSNISNALNCAMNILRAHSRTRKAYLPRVYDWTRDFPIQLQSRKTNLQSRFRLEFFLNEDELVEFHQRIGSRLNGTITIEIIIGPNNLPEIKVPKQGKNASTLTLKSDIVAKFISEKISVNYIPAIRTETSAMHEIRETVVEQLEVLEKNESYIDAMNTISRLQQNIMDEISNSIKQPLQEFMPKIKEVKLQIADERRRSYFRSGIDIIIDDGNPTNIELKGDGIKSLTAIALLKEHALKSDTPVIIIEEPESHLHPEAINQLNTIIESLSENNQVIVTTHNPLFVVRDNISSNIIIDNGTAKPAKSLREVREILGIKISDNLINSKYILVVEGNYDKEILRYVLPMLSEKIEKSIKQNLLTIYELSGASSLSYILALLKNMLCTYTVLLDDDEEGKKAFDKASKDNLIKAKDVIFTTCIGMAEAEFEDCIKPTVYQQRIKEEYGVDLSIISDFKKNGKWSNRVKSSFKKIGKPWNDIIENQVKALVVEEIKNHKKVEEIIIPQKKGFLDGLVSSIENMITEI